jgi:hypothetical protein
MPGVGLAIRYGIGALVALPLAVPIFLYALITRRRPFHPHGVVCRAEVTALDDVVGPRLAGPALVRLGPAFQREEATAQDVLALAIRFRRAGQPLASEADARHGDQDLIAASMESFRTVRADHARTDVSDYLGNEYSTVTVWTIDGLGPGLLRALPPPPAPRERGTTRLERLDADIQAGRAVLTLEARDLRNQPLRRVAELRLVERLPWDGRRFRTSMLRSGRGLRPTGFRNGIRVVVYPVSQVGRRIFGG